MKKIITTSFAIVGVALMLTGSFAQESAKDQEKEKKDIVIPQSSVLEKSEIAPPVLIDPNSAPSGPIQKAPGSVSFVGAPNCCCDTQCGKKVAAHLCLTDCDCCDHKVCVKVPCCCCNHLPTVKWRDGILGRKIAILCWPSCDYSVKVVVTGRGDVRVRYNYLLK